MRESSLVIQIEVRQSVWIRVHADKLEAERVSNVKNLPVVLLAKNPLPLRRRLEAEARAATPVFDDVDRFWDMDCTRSIIRPKKAPAYMDWDLIPEWIPFALTAYFWRAGLNEQIGRARCKCVKKQQEGGPDIDISDNRFCHIVGKCDCVLEKRIELFTRRKMSSDVAMSRVRAFDTRMVEMIYHLLPANEAKRVRNLTNWARAV